jgi:bacterioferritin (cytochrome b1)
LPKHHLIENLINFNFFSREMAMRQKNFVIASLLAVLFTNTTHAVAGIYKLVDENGHITYTNTPVKGGQKLQTNSSETRIVAKAMTRAPLTIGAFPKVTDSQQKKRDVNRRQILESELASETKHLVEIQQALNEAIKNMRSAEPHHTQLLSDTHISENENIKKLRNQISLHERNIMALRAELGNR